MILWAEDHWKVRDLRSRNGTFVNNKRIQLARLRPGTALQFGRRSRSWVLEDASYPKAFAKRAEDNSVRMLEDGMVSIPDSEEPLAMVFEDSNGEWVLEMDGGRRPATDRETVTVDGGAWTLFLPQGLDTTMVPTSIIGLMVEDIGLDFRVSHDEELVNIVLMQGKKPTRLVPRAHHYMLLTLARKRVADKELPEGMRGWVYRDDLEHDLKLDSTHLNVQVHRARQELHRAGVTDSGSIVERRNGQLRIGVRNLTIQTM